MQHSVYKHWDRNGVLLYVGCCRDVERRTSGHMSNSPWYDEIADITSEEYPDRKSGLKAEKKAIQEGKPLYNIMHHPDRPPLMEVPVEPPLTKNGTLGIEGARYRLSKACYDAGGVEQWAEKNGLAWSNIYSIIRGEKKPSDRILDLIGIEAIIVKKTPEVNPMVNVSYD